jgi:hypothetical protein
LLRPTGGSTRYPRCSVFLSDANLKNRPEYRWSI